MQFNELSVLVLKTFLQFHQFLNIYFFSFSQFQVTFLQKFYFPLIIFLHFGCRFVHRYSFGGLVESFGLDGDVSVVSVGVGIGRVRIGVYGSTH